MFWRRETYLACTAIRTPDCRASSLVTIPPALLYFQPATCCYVNRGKMSNTISELESPSSLTHYSHWMQHQSACLSADRTSRSAVCQSRYLLISMFRAQLKLRDVRCLTAWCEILNNRHHWCPIQIAQDTLVSLLIFMTDALFKMFCFQDFCPRISVSVSCLFNLILL